MPLTDDAVRRHVYEVTVERGRPPFVADAATALGASRDDVRAAFGRLREQRLLLLAGNGEIVMAPPFSAVPTPFRVVAGGGDYFANCVWDAYGVAAALGREADVEASCGCCGEPMRLAVRGGRTVLAADDTAVAHFAVPAAHWWADLPYT
jgi:hypothetical protein